MLRRLVLATAMVAVSATAVTAQLPAKIKGRLPAPAAAASSAPTEQKVPEMTADQLDRFIAGATVERDMLDQAAARARSEREKQQQQQQNMVQDMSARMSMHSECVDSVSERDPKRADAQKIRMQAGNAALNNRLDEAKRIMAGADSIESQIHARAEQACEKYKFDPVAYAQQNTDTRTLESESDAIASARPDAETAGAKAAGMTATEYAWTRERVMMYLAGDKRGKFTAAERGLLDARAAKLKHVLSFS